MNKLIVVHCLADTSEVIHDSVGIASVCECIPCNAPFHFLKSTVKPDLELAESDSRLVLSHQPTNLSLSALTRNCVAFRAATSALAAAIASAFAAATALAATSVLVPFVTFTVAAGEHPAAGSRSAFLSLLLGFFLRAPAAALVVLVKLKEAGALWFGRRRRERNDWAEKCIIHWNTSLRHGSIERVKECRIVVQHTQMVLSSNQRLRREEGNALHCVEVFKVGASLISLGNDDVHGDLNVSHGVDKFIGVGGHCCTIFHILAENTNSSVLLHMLEVFQTCASQKRVLHGGLEVVEADEAIHSTAIAEICDVSLASWSEQVCDVEVVQSLVKSANRCKISHRQPEIFDVDGQTGSQIHNFADLGADLIS